MPVRAWGIHQSPRNGGLESTGYWWDPCAWHAWGRLAARNRLCSSTFKLCTDSRFGLCLLANQRVQHGQQEGGRLAATRLAGDHQIDEASAFGA